MTNSINFANVIQGEYSDFRYQALEDIRISVRKLLNGKYSVLFNQLRYNAKLKKLGYKLRCNELVVENEKELIEILKKLEYKLEVVNVVIK